MISPPDDGQGEVHRALDHPLAAAELRGLDVDERQPIDRPRMDSRARDVRDARRQHELLPAGLQAPRDLLDLVRRQVSRAGHCHRAGT